MTRDSTDEGAGSAESGARTDGSAPSAILSANHRAFLRGEKDDVSDPDQYEANLRHRANRSIDPLVEDLNLLEQNGHEDIVARFYYRVNRIERLRRACEWPGNPESNTSTE